MRSKHDNVTFLERQAIENLKPTPSAPGSNTLRSQSTPAIGRDAERASHPEFPLERICSHRYEPFQLAFARNAQQHFLAREDVEAVASHQGLSMRAETEDAIDAAIVILEDLYGPQLHIGPPTIRYHQGISLEQPWMGLSIRCTSVYVDRVNRDLIGRGAKIVSCAIEPEHSLIVARAPLSALLGYRHDLEKFTAGSARHAMWLSHYAPIDNPPPDGRAA